MTAPLTDVERRALGRKARNATLEALEALGGEAHRHAIRDHARERFGFTARELCEPAPEGRRSQYATLLDYRLSWALTNLKRDGLLEKLGGGVWRLVPIDLASDERISQGDVSIERLAALRGMRYEHYLQTPEWRATRAAMLVRAAGHCQLDATHRGTLEVHHSSYERKGVEHVSDLIVLCADCHRLHHGQREPDPMVHVPIEWVAPRPKKPSLLRRLLAG